MINELNKAPHNKGGVKPRLSGRENVKYKSRISVTLKKSDAKSQYI
jgi:hypothetical protein